MAKSPQRPMYNGAYPAHNNSMIYWRQHNRAFILLSLTDGVRRRLATVQRVRGGWLWQAGAEQGRAESWDDARGEAERVIEKTPSS